MHDTIWEKIKTYACCSDLPTTCEDNSQMAGPRGINVKLFLRGIILKEKDGWEKKRLIPSVGVSLGGSGAPKRVVNKKTPRGRHVERTRRESPSTVFL